ncbi:MAG TPA: ABC transporter substrate-binding protein [Burkholderiales bacterium]|nr:ABC transporter substrate-binding protein [Burkholderiales bacterium]
MKNLFRLAAALLLLVGATAAHALDKVTYLTNWFAEAEHGGYYQAVAEGIYQKYGLDVHIGMGGPQVNVYQLLLAEKADFVMGYDNATISAIEQGLPVVTVAANFQSEPVGLIAHPDVKKIEDLKTRTLLIGQASETTYWPWLKSKYGFTEAQKKPYAYSVQQFLIDKNIAQQGYITSEPYAIEKGGVKPVIFHLAAYGYPPYAQTVVTLTKTVKNKPDLIKRFIEASALGWKSYLKNPAPGNALIKKDNPQMDDEQLAFSVAKLKEYGIVDGGDAKKLGLFTMTDARWKQTFEVMRDSKLVKPDVDYKKAYTLEFVKQVKVLP